MLSSESSATVFGVRFATGTMQQALQQIDDAVKQPAAEAPRIGAFVNADCLNQAFVNPEYAQFLQETAQWVWPDGIGVALAARHAGTPVRENVNGTDMFPLLCQRGYSLYFLGGAAGVAATAAEQARRLYPKARIAGADEGFFAAAADETAVLEHIAAAAPDILLVGMGVPKQEFWIASHRAQLKCHVAIGVGGLFDFVSGRIPRAPSWMRRLKLEWLFRFLQEPRRLFRRYILGNPLFLWRVYFHSDRN